MTTTETVELEPAKRRRVRKLPVTTCQRIRAAIKQTNKVFKEREDAIEVSWISKLTGMNYIQVGDPGTGKTALEKATISHIEGATRFKIQLHSFSTPNDIVGRYDLGALQRGEEKRRTEGKILESHFAMFDEVLKAGEGCANSVLDILNEREFEGKKLSLVSIGAATNWPEVDRMSAMIAAFWDRFHLRCVVSSIKDKKARLSLMKTGGSEVAAYAPSDGTTISLDELRTAQKEVAAVTLSDSFCDITDNAVLRLRAESIEVSDRRVLQILHAAKAKAWLSGRTECFPSDLCVINWMGWNRRKDVTKAAAVVDTIDVEAARELIRMIDETYRNYQSTRHALNPESAAEMMNKLIETKELVNNQKDACKFTKRTLKDVEVAEDKLLQAWQELASRFDKVLED